MNYQLILFPDDSYAVKNSDGEYYDNTYLRTGFTWRDNIHVMQYGHGKKKDMTAIYNYLCGTAVVVASCCK